ncbi:MAG: hypothetical protein QG670_2621 [Thermoproteota archaeon]|nr:hypothetical protein [Thermoproteota archaeon]
MTGFRLFEKINDITKKPVEIQEATKLYKEFIMNMMPKAVDEAIAEMRSMKMEHGYRDSYGNVNRNQDYVIIDEKGKESVWCSTGVNPEKPVYFTLFVMKIEDLNGKPIAFFVNYAVQMSS